MTASADEYRRFRNAPGCGHMTGTAGSRASICGKPPTHRVAPCPFNANGLACSTHAAVARRSLYATAPIIEEP